MERRSLLTAAAALTATALIPPPGALAAPRRARAPQDWMAAHADTTPLQRLTIPGTHNSGARFGGLWAQCQTTTIAEQLGSGIRFLDIRCRITGDAYAIHHGPAYQNAMFGDVLTACRDFLAAHPSETVLMRVRQEYSEESDAAFRRIFDLYLDGKGWRSLFRIGDGVPRLGEARGRVVLLADNGGLPGVRYGDGALFDIQDEWNAAPAAKYPRIEAHFRRAVEQPGRLFVNYVSTAAYLPPRWNADNLNPRVHSFLDGAAGGWRGLGIVPLDFPATRAGLVESLLRHN
ncbi:phosphatidylinositol-specific phospholipase C [Streptomyces clavuligerus]|uniref:1-phosphatidylinositol phosphodiesterase n=4 Tax=Streptomyces clavuligerus TaxID=1901 RepID=B5GP69_STRCL|nr:phosphatidylinositol-specific phospholipase C [Streptomyces clavuligerus]ANW19029.1 phospholipase [Streptomyces clavuligerus]AXU13610.1 phospholipase [Streptomyces clavuligerus]EDY48115.1 phosphatidylinositol diacylglycerol-lyase [Streptomyces clavuligerus]EFG08250.1 Phosphatidylinositol diacylglycerol-lyase [Streptomyces clavuligerus]MBY6303573.1 phosphatidylinositol-specific phospholipase C [Streptomyces clavuligerus]